MLHQLKIKQCYLCHLLEGTKTFEIRKNDRDFQVGDRICFLPVTDSGDLDENYATFIPEYRINYVLADFGGLQQKHVCLAIKPIG